MEMDQKIKTDIIMVNLTLTPGIPGCPGLPIGPIGPWQKEKKQEKLLKTTSMKGAFRVLWLVDWNMRSKANSEDTLLESQLQRPRSRIYQ